MERIWQAEMSKLDRHGNIVSAGIMNIREQSPEGTTEMTAQHDRGGDEREARPAVSEERAKERAHRPYQSEIGDEGPQVYTAESRR